MNIAFVCNENYAIYLYVAIKSILQNANKEDCYTFFIFHPNLSEKSQNEILQLKNKYHFEIEFIKINPEEELKEFPIWKAYNSKLAHYRFKISKILNERNIHKFLYLDCDIIVNASLAELYNTDLEDYALGLVPSGIGDEEQEYIPKLKLMKNHKYTYSGLMLVDIEKFQLQNLYEKIINIAKSAGDTLHWPDMDILNLACNGNNYKELSPKYSINPGFKGFCQKSDFIKAYKNVCSDEEIINAFENPIIWQLAGGAKPFAPDSLPNIKKVFYTYLKGTIWEKQAKKCLPKPLLNKLFKKLINVVYYKDVTEQKNIRIKKYKIFGITVHKKLKMIPMDLRNFKIEHDDKCLCICPHADDEIIGLGGLMILMPQNFDVLCLNSSGVAYNGLSAKERSDIRIKEFNSVMQAIGIKKYKIFEGYGQPPMFEQINAHIKDYNKAVNLKSYDYIFLPYINDSHPEHQYATKNIFPKMLNFTGIKNTAQVVMYEVWTPIENPNAVVDINSVIDEKLKILNLYKSQISDEYDYVYWTKALNQYRSMQAMSIAQIQTKYAEVFKIQPISTFLKNLQKEKKY